jgi:hypothetical protein
MSVEIDTPPQTTGYLLFFRGGNWEESGLSEGQIRQTVDKVKAWFDRLSASGKLVSAQPLMDESVVIAGKPGSFVTDAPMAEAKEVVGGYVLLSVDSKEEAVAIAKSNPMHEHGLITTEVRATASSCPHLYQALSRKAEAVG